MAEPAAVAAAAPARRSRAWRQVRRAGQLRTAGPVVALLLAAAALGPARPPHEPNRLDPQAKAAPPSAAHWLGTDEFGRDLLSRLVHGARITLLVGLASVAVAAAGGTLLGSGARYAGRGVEAAGMRTVDALLLLPPVLPRHLVVPVS